jgi:glycosyltransferase involved in cell wall biosynthesis
MRRMAQVRRILYVHRSIGASYGGSLVDLLNIVSHLDKARYVPTVLLSCGNEPLPRFHRLGVETACLPLPAIRKGKSLPFIPSAILRMRQLLRAKGISLVHVNDADDAAIASLACRLAGIPCIVHMRSEMVPGKFRKLRLQWADLLIAVSEGVREKAIQGGLPPEKVVTVRSGIDPRMATAGGEGLKVRREHGVPPETFLLGSVGNIAPVKGYDILIRAVAKARQDIDDLACLILGANDHGLRAELERLGESLGLDGRLIFVGFREQVFPYLDAMDLFVLPSVDEGFGIVLLEAMSVGKPVVATAVAGPLEIVEDGLSGLLVPPRDPEALSKALVELLKDPRRRASMGKRGRERVEALFSLDSQMRSLTALYDRLLLERQDRPRGSPT